MEGFVPIYRKITEWEWYDCPKTKAVFLDLLLYAAHTDSKWHGEIVKRGELITSIAKIANRNGMTPKAVNCALKRLEKSDSITRTGTNRFTKIKLLNHDLYSLTLPDQGKTTGKGKANKGGTKVDIQEVDNVNNENTVAGLDFNVFWDAYPAKKAKKHAQQTFTKLHKNGDLPAISELLHAIDQQKHSDSWQEDGGKYIPHPATWLNRGRWNDDISMTTPTGLHEDDIRARYGEA